MTAISSYTHLEEVRKQLIAGFDPTKRKIAICTGTGCIAFGAKKLVEAIRAEVESQGLTDTIEILETGCHGFCQCGPQLVLHPERTFYPRLKPEDAKEIVSEAVLKNVVIDRLLFEDVDGKKYQLMDEVPFYQKQHRLLVQHHVFMDPYKIEDYLIRGGYSALSKVLSGLKPEEVIDLIKKSGLRGRGGGGFLTGRKWESCRKAHGDIKYVICNADEGDPGAFMDGYLLESNPHSVIEGMIIAAFAIGSHEGYVYVRHEYPNARKKLGKALEVARAWGFLGQNILGSGFDFDIKVNRGGGAFVCGESTALMNSIEGKIGEPRSKHIHTVEAGLNMRPSNLNNVETYANVPMILNNGLDWYTQIGTEGSKGTKIFAMTGKLNYCGMVEIPMGATLRQIIFDIGGGMASGKKFKAVQTGGPSGGCIPENLLDTPVDFDSLTKLGSMMGSGGMIVMDEGTCMVDVAKYFLDFLRDESCGKCTTCREGLKRMYQIAKKITDGKGEEGDIDLLKELSEVVAEGSLCQLAGSAPNPVISSIRYFLEEWEEHVKQKKCRAKVCKSLIKFTVIADKCPGCQICARECPSKAVKGAKKMVHEIIQDKCIQCGICFDVCKFDAIHVE